ncbi:hypothetical protein E2C01_048700 [Portunus trituberculatus]|uniref:Uncharacterized protein n=1 Tax=Portunus trituberculatus TaxID=210409 RepID=A0A5B7GBS4_PORTR|nr:hypothetical protein [Portunus trituberculatus]
MKGGKGGREGRGLHLIKAAGNLCISEGQPQLATNAPRRPLRVFVYSLVVESKHDRVVVVVVVEVVVVVAVAQPPSLSPSHFNSPRSSVPFHSALSRLALPVSITHTSQVTHHFPYSCS